MLKLTKPHACLCNVPNLFLRICRLHELALDTNTAACTVSVLLISIASIPTCHVQDNLLFSGCCLVAKAKQAHEADLAAGIKAA